VGVSCFDKIIKNIERLIRIRDTINPFLKVNLTFVVTKDNINNLPQFILLASKLRVNNVFVNHITVFAKEHLSMSCFFEKSKTNDILYKSRKIADKLGINVSLPYYFDQAFQNYNICSEPWKFTYIEINGSVVPCCYAGKNIRYLDGDKFDKVWNHAGYKELRKGLVTNQVMDQCKYCHKYNPNNVNDIRSHISPRYEVKQEIFKYLREHRDEYPLPEENIKL
jgi:MoaA/NifB/PqqE/SkfB family radical SAM enzyme